MHAARTAALQIQQLAMHSLSVLHLVLQLVLNVSAEHLLYVKPNDPSLSCSSQPCLTWDQYALQQGSYFTNGATFLFLPGTHNVQFTVSLVNKSNVTLRKSETSSFVALSCNTSIAIQCRNITNFKVDGIQFKLSTEGTTNNVVS